MVSLDNSQGFSGTGVVKTATKGMSRDVKLMARKAEEQEPRATYPRATIAEGINLATPQPMLDNSASVAGLHKIQGAADKVWNYEFFGGTIVGGILAWAAAKTGNFQARAFIKSITHAPVHALRETPLNKLGQLPAKYMEIVSGYAKESALYKVAQAHVPKAERTWNPMKAFNNSQNRKEEIKKFIETIDLETADLGGMKGAERARKMALGTAEKAKNLSESGEKFGTAVLEQTRSATSPIRASVKNGLTSLESTGFGRGVEKLLEKLPNWSWLQNLKEGKTLTGAAKSIERGVGKMSLFGAIIAVGTTAAVSAAVLTARHKKASANTTLAAIEKDLGPDNAYFLSIKHSYTSQAGKRTLGVGMSAAGEIMNGVLIGSSTGASLGGMGGDMAVMGGIMVIPMASQLLNTANPPLTAYATLAQAEAGKFSLSEQQKLDCLKVLVAALPSVPKNEGIYNKLVTPVANALMEKDLTLSQTMQLLGNDKECAALATEQLQLLEAKKAQAEAKTVTPETEKTVAATHEQETPEAANTQTSAEAAYHASAKPMPVIHGGHQTHGRVAQHQTLSNAV